MSRAAYAVELEADEVDYIDDDELPEGMQLVAVDEVVWGGSVYEESAGGILVPGNHRYLFALTKSARRHLPAPLPYPKFEGLAA